MPSQNPDGEELACPTCRASLALAASGARCPACAAEYPVEVGVLCTGRSDAFLGEFGAGRMAEFTRLARGSGAEQAMAEMLREAPGVKSILPGRRRANFLPLLGLDRRSRRSVLDLGSGLGAVSLELSECFERVFAVDQTFERLAFLKAMAEQKGRNSIRPVCHRDVLHLPFASGSLDAVVLVGVFEYLPLGYPERPVRAVQLGALKEIHRILAPGGVLFLATKNRYGWPNWLGARDNSGLRFGPLLPRPLAGLLSRAILGTPFRVVTDGVHRYRRLLRESGFPDPGFYWPVGGYQAPSSWIDLADAEAIREGIRHYPAGSLKRGLLSLLAGTGLFGHGVPHLGIVAGKPREARPDADRLPARARGHPRAAVSR